MTNITPEMQSLFDSIEKPKFWRQVGPGMVVSYSTLLSQASVADRKLAWKARQHPHAKKYRHLSFSTLGIWEPRDWNWVDALNFAMPTLQMANKLIENPNE